jgi:non-ribosomal peptide synthetase component F
VIYDPVLFTAATVAGFKTEFRKLLDLAMSETPLDLSSFPSLMTHIPRLLPVANTARFHAMFEDQAFRNPMAAALFSGERRQSITYSELNEKSNQIAHRKLSLV